MTIEIAEELIFLEQEWAELQHIIEEEREWYLWQFCDSSKLPVEFIWNYTRITLESALHPDEMLAIFYVEYMRRIVPGKIELSPRQRVFWNLFDSYAEAESNRSKWIHDKTKDLTQFYFCNDPQHYWDLLWLKPNILPEDLNIKWSLLEFDCFSNIYERRYVGFYLNHRPYYADYPAPLGMTHQGKPQDTPPMLKLQANVIFDPTTGEHVFEPMVLEDLLWGLRAKREDIDYLSEVASFQPCKIMRQDDNGHTFEFEVFDAMIDARWKVEELSKITHKQTFWIEPIKPS